MTSTDTGEPVAWRYLSKAKNAKWTVQKNKPVNSFVADCEVEPLYPASALTAREDEIKRLRDAIDAADRYFAFRHDYQCIPASEFYEKHPEYIPDSGSKIMSQLRTAYSEARATLDAPNAEG